MSERDQSDAQASDTAKEQDEKARTEDQAKEAEKLDAKTTYEVIRREGERELERSTGALFWSGLAAGLSMGFSFLAQGLLHAHLPDAAWRPLVVNIGYSVGFLIVILGSQQLFTENTLTPIVPLLSQPTRERLRNVLRLWGAVLVSNVIGAFIFALVLARMDVVAPEVIASLSTLARTALEPAFGTMLLHAIYAGWLIALMVWMLPGAETAKVPVIVMMTFLVGLGGFAHVIAGASEVFFAAWRGEATWGHVLTGFVVPALIGNVTGGLTMVAALNHAQATSGEE